MCSDVHSRDTSRVLRKHFAHRYGGAIPLAGVALWRHESMSSQRRVQIDTCRYFGTRGGWTMNITAGFLSLSLSALRRIGGITASELTQLEKDRNFIERRSFQGLWVSRIKDVRSRDPKLAASLYYSLTVG